MFATDSDLKFYVIGDPIEHSLSPIMQNFFLEKFRIKGHYAAALVRIDQLDNAVRSFIEQGVTGINVTTPHKNEVIKFIDEFTAEAEQVGSVNTIKIKNGRLIGHNTDAIGFETSLQRINFQLENKKAVVFGAGGAARAIVAALARGNCSEIVVCNRHLEKARNLVDKFSGSSAFTMFSILPIDSQGFGKAIRSAHLLVNATTVGMSGTIEQSPLNQAGQLHEKLLVYDLIYRPYKTKLILQAEQKGVPWMNGIDMLIFQGFESLKFWIEKELVLDDAIYAEVRKLLRSELCQE